MKRILLTACVALMWLQANAQDVSVSTALFQRGDDLSWAQPGQDDASWREIDITRNWDKQGLEINDGYGWYRIHVKIPSALLRGADQQKVVVFNLPKADDVDECYLNGKLIGKTGGMPGDKGGYHSAWSVPRRYPVAVKGGGIRWDEDNVIAIRVYNGGEPGGLFDNPLTVTVPSAIDGLSMHFTDVNDGKSHCDIELRNAYPLTASGTLSVTVTDRETGARVGSLTRKISPAQGRPVRVSVPYDRQKSFLLTATYADAKSGRSISRRLPLKYILPPRPLRASTARGCSASVRARRLSIASPCRVSAPCGSLPTICPQASRSRRATAC